MSVGFGEGFLFSLFIWVTFSYKVSIPNCTFLTIHFPSVLQFLFVCLLFYVFVLSFLFLYCVLIRTLSNLAAMTKRITIELV